MADRFLKQVYLPDHDRRFATSPEGSAPFAGILVIHEGRSNDNADARTAQLASLQKG